jgi:hypothetical protein
VQLPRDTARGRRGGLSVAGGATGSDREQLPSRGEWLGPIGACSERPRLQAQAQTWCRQRKAGDSAGVTARMPRALHVVHVWHTTLRLA